MVRTEQCQGLTGEGPNRILGDVQRVWDSKPMEVWRDLSKAEHYSSVRGFECAHSTCVPLIMTSKT